MNVAVITAYTPTPENRNGISALIYAILAHRPENVRVCVYSYNMNCIPENEIPLLSEKIRAEIRLVNMPKWYKILSSVSWLVMLWSVFFKKQMYTYIKPNLKVVEDICKNNVDFVWVYPYFFYKYSQKIPEKKFVVTGCDCISNVCCSRFSDVFFLRSFKRSVRLLFSLRNAYNVEEELKGLPNVLVHYVGMDDYNFYSRIHMAKNAFFLLHPHYALQDKSIKFDADKLKVLIAGKNDHYMTSEAEIMIGEIVKQGDLAKCIEVAFLGKGWEQLNNKMIKCGFSSKHIKWVESYAEEVVKYDVQIAPISNGGGTKGKVLDGIGNGLLMIGSTHALENICVRHMDSCVHYKKAADIPAILRAITLDKGKYEKIAEKGRCQVRKYHNPERISKRFFSILGEHNVFT